MRYLKKYYNCYFTLSKLPELIKGLFVGGSCFEDLCDKYWNEYCDKMREREIKLMQRHGLEYGKIYGDVELVSLDCAADGDFVNVRLKDGSIKQDYPIEYLINEQ
ncbi:hypothetical protein [Gracilimonas sediminicola]|uniref:Uncharacterized protein n=1 Tax=Gracilimonas sediminicola TaxID=2952158 RepID=A0A9X2RAV3_9BACT|nr:hypothetical protein [Gracilimonas sediminicola]MCP9290005.1 hypothetical protein [Gracilimonas sediminicola]